MTAVHPERPASRRKRVAFVNSHPIQYFAPLYAWINRSADIEAVPIYLSDFSLRGGFDKGFGRALTWDIDLLAGTDPIFVKGASSRDPEKRTDMIAPDIWRIVRNGGFDAVVVHGVVYGANYIAFAAAKSAGIPVLMRADSHSGLTHSGLRGWLRSRVAGPIYRRLDGILAVGSANRAFFRSFGIPADRIFDFPFTVDNDRMAAASRLGEEERAAQRRALGLRPGYPAALFASKLTRRKNADQLIAACTRLADEGSSLDLVIAGAGEMEDELRRLAQRAPPALNIVFPGFLNQSELPRVFAACDLFVLPSEEEPWGLIVNEAMAAGLPIVASREVGAVADLVRDGDNGHVFEAGDVAGLADALRPIVTDPERRAAMADRSRAIIEGWSYREAEAGLRAMLAYFDRERER